MCNLYCCICENTEDLTRLRQSKYWFCRRCWEKLKEIIADQIVEDAKINIDWSTDETK
jgi:hypothetical protein